MATSPSTVLKALSLMDFFSERRPSIGLSEFSKLSGYNKATTLRFLTALEIKGFVEQDETTRMYNLGPAFLRFSQLREASFPLTEAVKTVLRDLHAATNETVHASVIAGQMLANIGVIESKKAIRVIVEPGEALPFHATASGLAYLAFATPEIVDAALLQDLKAHAEETITDPEKIRDILNAVRLSGVAFSQGSYEDDVLGIAVPYFGPSGKVCGAVATALPSVRASEEHKATIVENVKKAARRLTALRGGINPEDYPDN